MTRAVCNVGTNKMKSIKKAVIFVFIVCFCVIGNSQTSSVSPATLQPADLLEHFMEMPPPFLDATYEEMISGFLTNYYSIKWQSNAVFIGRSQTDVANDSSADFTEWLGKYDQSYWFKSYNAYITWTDEGITEENSNTVEQSYQRLIHDPLAVILNCGCAVAEPGSIHWMNDKFEATNHYQNIWLHGQLTRDSEGRAAKLFIQQGPLGLANPNSTYYPWEYDLFYQRSFPLQYYPSKIIGSFKTANGESGPLFQFDILTLNPATNLMDAGVFHLIPETNAVVIAVSNRFLVYQNGGRINTKYDLEAAAINRTRVRGFYFLLGFSLFSIIPFLLWWARKR